MTIQEILEEIPSLSIAESKQRNILEFAGIGAELYNGTDAQEYINQVRREWDK